MTDPISSPTRLNRLLPAVVTAGVVAVIALVLSLIAVLRTGDSTRTSGTAQRAPSSEPVTAPSVTRPAGTEPARTGPAATGPGATGPGATAPGATAPASTASPAAHGFFLGESFNGSGDTVLSVRESDTGKVVRDVYRAGTYRDRDDRPTSPILDAELAADGTVYLTERNDPSDDLHNRPGGTRLVRVTPDGTRSTLKENVLSTELTPDGHRLAYVVLSPDGDGDGNGTSAIRVLNLGDGKVDTLQADELPLSPSGEMTTETMGYQIVGWTPDATAIVVEGGCCDSGTATIIPATAALASSSAPWPKVDGDFATYALGFDPTGWLLVQRDTFAGDGVKVPMSLTGFEVVGLDPHTGNVSAPLYTEPSADDRAADPRYELAAGDSLHFTPVAVAFDRTAQPCGADPCRRVFR